ncbi:hypothetical protein ABN261_08930, partial [Escherichia coli]
MHRYCKMDITEFPSGVIEHLGWYVYRL